MALGPLVVEEVTQGDDFVIAQFPETGIGVKVTIRTVDGVPEIVGLAIGGCREIDPATNLDPTDWPEIGRQIVITGDILRALPLRQLRDSWHRAHPRGTTKPTEVMQALFDDDQFEIINATRPVGQQPLTRALLERVADTYREAVDDGHSPIQAISRSEGVKEPTARKYVRRAREEGLLAWPARPGRPGATEARSPITGATATAAPQRKRGAKS